MNVGYLTKTLGLEASEREWPGREQLPLYLREGRAYSVLEISGIEILLIHIDQGKFNLPAFQKQTAKLREYWRGSIALQFNRLSTYQRKALIENRIAFIVPNSQIYLPALGMMLQERMPKPAQKISALSGMSQYLLLHMMLDTTHKPAAKADLARRLELPAMTITRAVRELISLGLAETRSSGRSDIVSPTAHGRQLYEKAKPYLIDPVQKRLYVAGTMELGMLPMAGESALAAMSMLNPPAVMCRAMGRKALKALGTIECIDPAWGENYIELEIWKYDPVRLASKGLVDAVSLSLSLAQSGDERIEQAIEEMLEVQEW